MTKQKKQDGFEVAEGRIQKALKTGAKELDLSELGLSELPESLGQLSPLHHAHWIGPCLEHEFRRCIDDARDDELALRGFGSEFIFFRHDSSPSLVIHSDTFRENRVSHPRIFGTARSNLKPRSVYRTELCNIVRGPAAA